MKSLSRSMRFCAVTGIATLALFHRTAYPEEGTPPAQPGQATPAPAADAASPAPSFPGTISVEVRARYYYVHNLYDKNNKIDDNLNLGTEFVRVRAEGKPIDELTLRLGVFQVHSLGLGGGNVLDFPAVVDDQRRQVELDRALVEWKPPWAPEWTLSVGRQDIVLGNGFLIGDGVRLVDLNNLIGYIENNRQDFDAVRLDWKPDGWTMTAFGAFIPDTEAGKSLRELTVAGIDIEKHMEGQRPALSLIYARDERPRTALLGPVVGFPYTSPLTPYTADDSNAWTVALSLRSKGPIVPPFAYSLEGVYEFGRSPNGANDNVLAPDMVHLRAWGIDARLAAFLHPERKDLVRVRYVQLSGDRDGKGNNEFDPLLENQMLGVLFNAQNNIRAWNVGASATSIDDWKFHVDFWHFRFDEGYALVLPYGLGRNGRLDAGRELDIVASRRWCPNLETELLAGILWPGDVWKPDNNNPIGFNTSNDWVWGVRLTATISF